MAKFGKTTSCSIRQQNFVYVPYVIRIFTGKDGGYRAN